MPSKDRFEQTRRAIERLAEVKALIMYDCDDWKPPTVKAAHETSDPTASRAIYRADELADKLAALKREEHELEAFIGETLAIIEAVRDGFGEIYANLLEWHYIDGQTWTQISKDKKLNRTYCYQLVDVAFDWIDSVGVSRLLRGEVDV